MNHELKLYRGEPVGILEITKEMEVPAEGLRVDVTKTAEPKTFYGFNQDVTVAPPREWTIHFQTRQILDDTTQYWVPLPDRWLQFDLPPPRKEVGRFFYTVVVPLRG